MNHDWKPDLIVSSIDWGAGIAVLFGNGNGTFQPAVKFDGGGGGTVLSLRIADVNQDEKPDIIAATSTGWQVAAGVLLGNGDGSFQPPALYSTPGYDSAPGYDAGGVFVNDVNRDGKLDLVTVLCPPDRLDCKEGMIGVLMGNGDGTFQPAVTSPASGFYVSLSAVDDLNGDSKPDVLVSHTADQGGSQGMIGVLQGRGNGTFQPSVSYASGASWIVGARAADVNGDKKPDAIISESCGEPSCVGVMLNNAGPLRATTTTSVSLLNPSVFGQSITFQLRVRSSVGTPTGDVAVMDGRTILTSARLVNGTASIPISSLAAGSHSIMAWYPISADFGGSRSR